MEHLHHIKGGHRWELKQKLQARLKELAAYPQKDCFRGQEIDAVKELLDLIETANDIKLQRILADFKQEPHEVWTELYLLDISERTCTYTTKGIDLYVKGIAVWNLPAGQAGLQSTITRCFVSIAHCSLLIARSVFYHWLWLMTGIELKIN